MENNGGASQILYQANRNFVTREIAGEVLVVPVGEQAQKLNGMISFSETGAFLWKLLDQPRSKADMVSLLAQEYEQKAEDVVGDVGEFLEEMLKWELIVKCE